MRGVGPTAGYRQCREPGGPGRPARAGREGAGRLPRSSSAPCWPASTRRWSRSPTRSRASCWAAASDCGRPSRTGASAAPAAWTRTRSSAAVAALEFVQASALIHDDVMDASDTRRGEPAVHRRFELMHAEQRLGRRPATRSAPAPRSCSATSAWPGRTSCCAAPGSTSPALLRARPVFDLMRTEVIAGQYLDVHAQATADTSLRRASTVARYKSAKYTVERPLLLGAAMADAPSPRSDGVLRLRAAARRGVPAARRHARRLRRPGRRPASRPATTCARASAPTWSRRRSRRPTETDRGRAARRPRRPGPGRRRRGAAARDHRRHRRAGPHRAAHRRPHRGRRWPRSATVSLADGAAPMLTDLALAATRRTG